MRLQSMGSNDETAQLSKFVEWIASIGDKTIGEEDDGKALIDITDDMFIKEDGDAIDSLARVIYLSKY
ncbi:hypothetical protein CASFOL_042781 [Castilleja foliolosa]|uniref:ATP-dependent DNA helicase n=1 Tax=Castilleja foliolosa TaxID=1961234 RepID=A0ABD3B855_9LAMI